ncbi:putative ferric-chelate reductase 1, partial [Diretmus argenteus]
MGSCGDLRPHHSESSPQANPAPFTVTAEWSSYREGEVTVLLQAPDSTPFAGFLLQAREVGGSSPLGSFSLTGEEAQLLTCNQKPNSAVSHTSESAKTSIQVTWRAAASGGAKPIEFQSQCSVTALVCSPQQTISSAGCNIMKVCFSQPRTCNPAVSSDCYFMSASMTGDASVQFELTGPSQGYISFGFSDDQMMGNDDIYICGLDSNGLVRLQHAFSLGRWEPQTLPLGNVSDVRASVQDGVISCSFTSMNPISTQRTTGFNKSYHLMFAHGPTINGQIRFHTGTFISGDRVDISLPQLVSTASRPHIIKAHGALMLTAWMTTGTLGMMGAKYLKGVKGRSYRGKDVWFL